MAGCTEFFKKYFCCLIAGNPRRNITIAWILSVILVIVSFIVACVAAGRMAKSGRAGVAAGFCAVWTALLLIVISIVGSVIMRKYKSTLAIGLFLGVIFVMTQQMLILFAIFVERSQVNASTQTLAVTQSQQAMAVFSWFLFMIYAAFGIMLYVFRNDLVVEDTSSVPVAEGVAIDDKTAADNENYADLPQYK